MSVIYSLQSTRAWISSFVHNFFRVLEVVRSYWKVSERCFDSLLPAKHRGPAIYIQGVWELWSLLFCTWAYSVSRNSWNLTPFILYVSVTLHFFTYIDVVICSNYAHVLSYKRIIDLLKRHLFWDMIWMEVRGLRFDTFHSSTSCCFFEKRYSCSSVLNSGITAKQVSNPKVIVYYNHEIFSQESFLHP